MANDPRDSASNDRGEEQLSSRAQTLGPTEEADHPENTQKIEERKSGSGVKRPGDRVFELLSTVSAALMTVIIAAIGIYLLLNAVPALRRNEGGLLGFFTFDGTWQTATPESMQFGIPNLFGATVLISVFALILAMPVALGIAIFLSNYAPKKAVKPLGYIVDMLAAVPSIVYGLWGWQVLGPFLSNFYVWINESWLSNIFLFAWDGAPPFATGRNLFTGGVVLAVMILPVIAATAREVFVQTPPGHIEAALALGATRWEVVRMTVLPFGWSGFVAGSMLGLGRALGETMALYMVVSAASDFRWSLLEGGTTFATAIANAAPEFNNPISAGAYIAAGLVLFLLTFVVNTIARSLVK